MLKGKHLEVSLDIHPTVCHDLALHRPHNLILDVCQRVRNYP